MPKYRHENSDQALARLSTVLDRRVDKHQISPDYAKNMMRDMEELRDEDDRFPKRSATARAALMEDDGK